MGKRAGIDSKRSKVGIHYAVKDQTNFNRDHNAYTPVTHLASFLEIASIHIMKTVYSSKHKQNTIYVPQLGIID